MIRSTIYFLFSIIITFTATAQEAVFHFDSDKIIYKDLAYFGSLSKSVVKEQVEGEKQLNFNPAISFNGVADYLKVNPELYSGFTQMTAITVFCPFGKTEEDIALWELDSELAMSTTKATNKSMELEYEGIEMDKPVIHTYIQYYKKNNRFLSTLLEELSIGNQSFTNTNFKGQIAELLLFNKVLNDEELQKITSSLALKYGISLKENQDYLAADNSIVWDATTDSLFSNRITGIACDSKNHLLQKQSTSTENPGFLTIGVEAIAASNNNNTGSLPDQNYLVWGDNNQVFEFINPDEESATDLAVSKRKWLMNATGIETLNTQLKIDAASILEEGIKNLFLVINENGIDEFNNAYEGLRFVYPSSIDENGIITYDNVQWDTNNSGSDVFAFVAEQNVLLFESNENNAASLNGQDLHFGLYPNITADGNYAIAIQLEEARVIEITVFDAMGRKQDTKSLEGSRFYFLGNEFIDKPGIYNVLLTIDQKSVNRKLIVR